MRSFKDQFLFIYLFIAYHLLWYCYQLFLSSKSYLFKHKYLFKFYTLFLVIFSSLRLNSILLSFFLNWPDHNWNFTARLSRLINDLYPFTVWWYHCKTASFFFSFFQSQDCQLVHLLAVPNSLTLVSCSNLL